MNGLLMEPNADVAGPIDKSVLLFSGGLDCLCVEKICKPDILLYVPMPSVSFAEEMAIHTLWERYITNSIVVKVTNVLSLDQYLRRDGVIPNRNAYLVLLASHYADKIMLAAVNGDQNRDTDVMFCGRMNDVLNYIWQPQAWCAGRSISVSSPVRHLTKTQLVRQYLLAGGSVEALRASYSCYEGGLMHCGKCKSCMRRRVALELNDINSELEFKYEYWDTDWFRTAWPGIQEDSHKDTLQTEEARDIVTHIRRICVQV